MAERQSIVSHLLIKIDGRDLSPDIQGKVIAVTVDQQVSLPGMVEIRLYDPELELLDSGPFDLAKRIEIQGKTATGATAKLFSGEVTGLEPVLGEGMIAELVVRGYDRSHRLYRVRTTRTYLNVKDSDLASRFAAEVNLKTKIDSTATVYEHVFQCNQSNLQFLQHRAWRIGYECFIDDDTLHFQRPARDSGKVAVAWGTDLITFRPRISVTEQVAETQVKGWDIQRKAPIVGISQSGDLHPRIPEKSGEAWAGSFGPSRMVIIDEPVVSQAEADLVAAARQSEWSGAFIEAEGEAFRRPDIQAGRVITIKGLGKRLSGDYLVTRAIHVYTSGGLHNRFSVTGARSGLLIDQLRVDGERRAWPGLVTAVVTNTEDPNGWGRVKVKYPWLSEDEESYWARVIAVGAGPASGLAAVPAVDDEVAVFFHQGDFNQPVVLGGLWNGRDSVPDVVRSAPNGEKPLVRTWQSRTGHKITMYDNSENRLLVETAGGHTVQLNDAQKTISLRSAGGLEIVMDDNGMKIVVKSSGDVEVSAAANLAVKGANVTIEATGTMDLKASGPVNVKGAMVNLN